MWNRSLSGRRRAPLVVGAIGLALAAGGCSSAAGGEGDSFTVALVEPDLTTAPLMAAVDAVREQGFEVETVELAEPELAIEGLSKGTYAISAEATSPALIAIEQGAPIKIVADVIGNQWAVYGQEGIASCDDLAGQPVGIFSEGAVATAMVRQWVAEECSSGEPEYLVIGGSDVRAQALLGGQIEATALEISDVVTLDSTAGASFTKVVDFAEALPELHPQTVYANADFLENSGDAARAFLAALQDEHDKINDDPEYLVGLAEKYLDEEPSETLSLIAQTYVDAGLFDAGGLTEANMQATIDFFVDAGVVSDLTVDQVADLSFTRSS